MEKINTKKLNDYADKLYRGILKSYKEQQEWKKFYPKAVRPERESIAPPQKIEVIEKSGGKCEICRRPYDTVTFEFHHINGDRAITVDENLLLVCLFCHKKIHAKAGNKLANRRVRLKQKIVKSKRKITKRRHTKEESNPLMIDTSLLQVKNL
jgi:predicted HNH restriction endonuclease